LPELSDILMHFSHETQVFYETVQALLDHLQLVVESLVDQAAEQKAEG